MDEVDVLIVGSGPAGTSTALHLVDKSPDWADRILVLDQAVHPRPKLCGGGVTHLGTNVLARLGYELETPTFAVREVRLMYEDLTCSFRGNPALNIVDRSEFDHWLVKKVQDRGVVVDQGERVIDLEIHADHVIVSTDVRLIRAKCVVGADGALSTIRRRLGLDSGKRRPSRMARLIEIETEPTADEQARFVDGLVIFDISPLVGNLQGYYWEFPKYLDGLPSVSRGVYDSRVLPNRPRASLKNVLREEWPSAGFESPIKGAPIRTYHRTTPVSTERALLVGDSAGVDSLFGEGISIALAFGEVAADTITEAFAEDDFSFDDYRRRIERHSILWALPWRGRLALIVNFFDRPIVIRAAFRIASLVLRFTRWADADQTPIERIRVGNGLHG